VCVCVCERVFACVCECMSAHLLEEINLRRHCDDRRADLDEHAYKRHGVVGIAIGSVGEFSVDPRQVTKKGDLHKREQIDYSVHTAAFQLHFGVEQTGVVSVCACVCVCVFFLVICDRR